MESFERARLDAYFGKIAARFRPDEPPVSFLITHLLPERPSFVRAVATASNLRAVLPKPKSVSPTAKREVERIAPCDPLSREAFADPDQAVEYVESRAAGERVVLLDVGGYFAPTLHALAERFSGTLLGVVEDTENGHKRYAELDKLPCPVVSVARSPLKDPEDYLVGQSVVFSTEALMIDVHPIPANPAKGEAAHQHYDFRYLFRTETAHVTVLQAEEVTGCAWRPADTLTAEPLRGRLLAAPAR